MTNEINLVNAEIAYDAMVSSLTEYLYQVDPAGTCCKENEVKDEYFLEAETTALNFEFCSNPSNTLYKYLIEILDLNFDDQADTSLISEEEINKIQETWQKSNTQS